MKLFITEFRRDFRNGYGDSKRPHFLATVGSTAPFVGLFGTVWAIYHALIGIGIAGEATLDKVADPWERH